MALSLKSEIKGDMEDVAADKRYEGMTACLIPMI